MNNEKQIDMVEEALRRAYSDREIVSTPSAEWKSTLMFAVKEEYESEEVEVEILENSFLYYSCLVAAVAAVLILVSGIVFAMQPDNIEEDLEQLYSDNTLETLSMEIASTSTY